jgi:hypothetical protein
MRALSLALAGLMLALVVPAASAQVVIEVPLPDPTFAAPTGLTAALESRSVHLAWDPATFPDGATETSVWIRAARDTFVGEVDGTETSFEDLEAVTGETNYYWIVGIATFEDGHREYSEPSDIAAVDVPSYLVGAAQADITPVGVVNLGGNGLGDGSVIPQAAIGRGNTGETKGEHIMARAMVISDGDESIAIADIETQGMFAAYKIPGVGLRDMAAQVAAEIPELPVDNILIASDHTHSGPDTIGAWGGPPAGYLEYVKNQTVAAITDAFAARRYADIKVGHSDASDLIYNQSCSEALNQSRDPVYPGPDLCATPGKDGMIRVLQATTPWGSTVVTYMAFAAHATLGGGNGLHGDWPQFLSEKMAETYGGFGLAMQGANGGTQPCRPACGFTKHDNPGYNVPGRREAYTLNYMAHVTNALATSVPVDGPVAGAQVMIREVVDNPFVLGLLFGGKQIGAHLLRSLDNPWAVGNSIGTIASALRVGNVVFAGTPGEGFPAIGNGVRNALTDETEVIQLGLANDQLGYLIAPVRYVPIIAAEVAVNDNIIFNVSPTIGDHVMCADIALALSIGLAGASPPECAAYNAADSAGDPIARLPIGGPPLP